jgi:PAS domain S-box-containing protein
MEPSLKFIHLEDDRNDAELVKTTLAAAGIECEIVLAVDRDQFVAALEGGCFDLIISDYSLPSFDGMTALALTREKDPDIPFIFLSGQMGEERAIDSLKTGATDYVLKTRLSRLAPAVRRALEEHHERLAHLQTEKALVESEEKMRIIADTAIDALISMDNDGTISFWNKAAERIFGYTSQEALGADLHKLLAPRRYHADANRNLAIFQNTGTGPAIGKTLELTAVRKDGTEFPVELSLATMNIKGKWCALGVLRDISDRKALESQLLQSQKLEAIGQLAGGVAHDFNNILTGIIGFTTLAMMKMDKDDPLMEYLDHVIIAANRAADLTKSMLIFSRKQAINPQPVNLNQIISKIEKFLKRIIGEDIELELSMEQEVLTINADSGQIEQVLMNLAANARDAMPKGGLMSIGSGKVEIDHNFMASNGYSEPGTYAVLSFSDSGEGMDETVCKKLFEPFFTTKEVGKGTGLGLSIVYGIVKQHKGFINVYSQPGIGTTFKIYLPLTQAVIEESPELKEGVIKGGKETILVADDDALFLDLAERAFSMFGYTVISAVNGSEALAAFKENRGKINLVILDIIMPKMNGKEAFDEMRKIDPDLKGIFVSGYTRDIIINKGLIDQSLNFLSKPVNPKELLTKVREVLESEHHGNE